MQYEYIIEKYLETFCSFGISFNYCIVLGTNWYNIISKCRQNKFARNHIFMNWTSTHRILMIANYNPSISWEILKNTRSVLLSACLLKKNIDFDAWNWPNFCKVIIISVGEKVKMIHLNIQFPALLYIRIQIYRADVAFNI